MKKVKTSDLKLEFVEKLNGLYTRAEAERLFFIGLEDLLGINAMQFRLNQNSELSEAQEVQINKYLEELHNGQPYQHLIGEVHFAGLKLKVGPQALIPRPETEELAYIIKDENQGRDNLKILDIGTGTGCLALACASYFHKSSVTALDVSQEAIRLASENAALNHLKIDFVQGSILDSEKWPGGTWDIIVSNPPYIGESEASDMDDLVTHYEPFLALFAPDDDVLVFYRKILELAQNQLTEGGKVYLEINQKWGPETLKLYTDAGFKARLLKDLSGNDRFVMAEKA